MATINEELTKLESTKADIKSALVEKGLNPTDEFSSYALNIRDILSGGGSIEPVGAFAITNDNKDNIVWPTNWADYKYIILTENLTPFVTLPDLTIDGNLGLIINIDNSTKHIINLNLIVNYNGNNLSNFYIKTSTTSGLGGDPPKDFALNIKIIGNNQKCIFNNFVYGLISNTLNVSCENIKIQQAQIMFLDITIYTDFSISGDFSECTSVMGMFKGANEYIRTKLNLIFPSLNLSLCINFSLTFYNCYLFNEILPLDTSNGNSLRGMFLNSPIIKIHEISVKNSTDNDSMFGYSWSPNPIPRYILIKDIGSILTRTGEDFYKSATNWGVEDASIPLSAGARQSVIDSLITYSFDRAAEGYPTYTIALSANTKALLTEEEIAQITAKGFTIA